jgi:hypothetical protein
MVGLGQEIGFGRGVGLRRGAAQLTLYRSDRR